MKRTISILLTALLLLIALPTFAEEEPTLQPGLYVSKSGQDTMYLDKLGCGVLNYDAGGQDMANGVLWTGTTLEIERAQVYYAVMGDAVIFTYDHAVRILHYAGEGAEYALGDRDTDFAGTYLTETGQKLTLAADGQGVYADADGENTLFWGSLLPYWPESGSVTENTCYVLFGSYLSGMEFADGMVTVSTETDGLVTFVRQTMTQPAAEDQLYYGYRMTTDGWTMELIPTLTALGFDPRSICLELRADGSGVFRFISDERFNFTWTEDAIIYYEGESIPYTREGDHCVVTVKGRAIEFAPAAEVEALLGGAVTEDTKTETDPSASGSLVGTWALTKIRAMGMEIPGSMVGENIVLTLNADGSAVLTSADGPMEMEWSVGGNGQFVLSEAGEEGLILSLDGTELSLYLEEEEDIAWVFEKDD